MKLLIILKILFALLVMLQLMRVLIIDNNNPQLASSSRSNEALHYSRNPKPTEDLNLREHWQARLQLFLPEQNATFTYLLVFGGSLSEFTPEVKNEILTSGLAHVVAASGMNVAFVLLLTHLWKGSHRLLHIVFTSGVVLVYAYLAEWGLPIIRAALGAVLLVVGKKVWLRQTHPLYLLLASAAFQLLLAPELIQSLSFQLTYLASFGVIALFPTLQLVFCHHPNKRFLHLEKITKENIITTVFAYLKTTLLVTSCCWVMVTPVLARMFGSLSLTTFISALLTAWLIPILFLTACVALLVSLFTMSTGVGFVLQHIIFQNIISIQNFFFLITHHVAQLQQLQVEWQPTRLQLTLCYGGVFLLWWRLHGSHSSCTTSTITYV